MIQTKSYIGSLYYCQSLEKYNTQKYQVFFKKSLIKWTLALKEFRRQASRMVKNTNLNVIVMTDI